MNEISNTTSVRTVVNCYDLLDLALRTGVRDFTDGMYHGDPTIPYEESQRNQAEYLLDQAGCQRGSRLLDIGCGYGRILESARERGASAIGITVSDKQVTYGRKHGLDIQLLDYRKIPDEYTGQFDCIIANGSLEHFVHPGDAASLRADSIYRELFQICHRVLDPESESGRFVTTAIHFDKVRIAPGDMIEQPKRFPRGSNEHHYSLLVQGYGGFYPDPGQLQRCARGRFDLFKEQDGTRDYHWTSEYWLQRLKKSLYTNPRFLGAVFWKLIRRPRHTLTMIDCLLISQSWNWQFRGENPPMKLLRQTWQRVASPM